MSDNVTIKEGNKEIVMTKEDFEKLKEAEKVKSKFVQLDESVFKKKILMEG